MSNLAKIVITIVILFVFFLIFGAIASMREGSGQQGAGFFGLILFAGLIGAIRAVWKRDKKDNDQDQDTSILQK